jgi:L-aminopeptidase/D-esterase-like protein
MAMLAANPAARAAGPVPGPNNAITDVPGIRVGHYTASHLTGATVVLAENGTAGVPGSVTQRGGSPGTRETDLLRPENMVNAVNAIALSGGGPHGLAVASGVMACLEARATGFGVGGGNVVPIVPTAVLLEPGTCGASAGPRPGFDAGMSACNAAATGPVAQGNVGAGAGAVSGAIKGGIGTASIVLENGVIVGALVAVNSSGSAHDEVGILHDPDQVGLGEFDRLRRGFTGKTPKPGLPPIEAYPWRGTLAVVATNVLLTKAQAIKIGEMAENGLARAIRPVHTPHDGDTVFTLGTGRLSLASLGESPLVLHQIGAAAGDVVARAVRHPLLQAESTSCHTSYCDTFATACRPPKKEKPL